MFAKIFYMIITESQLRTKIIEMCGETSNAEVARQCGVSRTYIGEIVGGTRRVSKNIALKLGYELQPQVNERIFKPTKNKS